MYVVGGCMKSYLSVRLVSGCESVVTCLLVLWGMAVEFVGHDVCASVVAANWCKSIPSQSMLSGCSSEAVSW